MSKSLMNLLFFTSLVGIIYLLRDSQSSPSRFLNNQITRVLDTNTTLQSLLCTNVDMSNGTASDIADYNRVGSFINSLRGGNKIDIFINGSSNSSTFGDEYGKTLLNFTIPFIVLLVIALVGTIRCMVNFCCMFCCSKSGTCCKVPNKAKPIKIVAISSIILMLFLFGVSIAGVTDSTRFSKGVSSTLCSVGIFVDKALLGPSTVDQKWLGVNTMVKQLIVALDNFQPSAVGLTPPATAVALANALVVPESAANSLYNSHKSDTIDRADPSIGGTYLTTYVQNLGPVSNTSTYMGRIVAEQKEKKDRVVSASAEINKDVPLWTGGVVTSLFWMNYVKEFATNTSYTLNNLTANLTKAGASGGTAVNGIRSSLIVLFSLLIGFPLLAIASMVIYRNGIKIFSKFLNVSWFFLVFLMILSCILLAILAPVTVGLVEGCQTFEKALTNPAAFNATFKKFVDGNESSTSRNVAYTCLFGDGDTMQAVGLRGNLNFADNLFLALDLVANLSESVGTVPDSLEIPSQLAYLNATAAGFIADSDVTTTDLATLNKITSSISNTCTTVNDVWTIGAPVCTIDKGVNFTSSSDETFNLPSITCIGLDVFASKTISKRYTSSNFPASCPNQGGRTMVDYVQTFVKNLERARTTLKSQNVSIQTDFYSTGILSPNAQLISKNNNFMRSLKDATKQLDDVRTKTKPVYNALGDANVGVFRNCYCRFIKIHATIIQDQMCHKAVPNLFAITIIILVLSIIGLFGVLTIFISIKRFASEEKTLSVQPVTKGNVLKEPLSLQLTQTKKMIH